MLMLMIFVVLMSALIAYAVGSAYTAVAVLLTGTTIVAVMLLFACAALLMKYQRDRRVRV